MAVKSDGAIGDLLRAVDRQDAATRESRQFIRMSSTADQHDPDWPKYPETVLRFSTNPRVEVDLRKVLSSEDVSALAAIGFSDPFAVLTAFDPRGQNLSREENDRLAAELESRLKRDGRRFVRVDACSSDNSHCECSVAVTMPKGEALALAAEFDQVAIFWFDGERFWIAGALVPTDPLMLPRSS